MDAAFDNVGLGLMIGIINGVVLDNQAKQVDLPSAGADTESRS